MKSSRSFSLLGLLCMAAAALGAAGASPAEEPRAGAPVAPAYPLWDGHESVAQYGRRVNLPETKTLDLGNGVSLGLVLIPAGKFIMGTPEPTPVDKAAFIRNLIIGQAVLAVGGGILLVLIAFSILRAIRQRRRFQYSLRRLMAMMFSASLCVLGGMHWWHSQRSLEDAPAEHFAAIFRYKGAKDFEMPAHEVTITKPFYMGKFEVTQEQFKQVMGNNPSHSKGPNLPVEMVSWNDAQEFCTKASSVQQSSGLLEPQSGGLRHKVRLPTEAEWEYACRAGTTTAYYSGDKEADLARVAWYRANSGGSTQPVGQKEPNDWALYDMHGNVWQWCADWHEQYKPEAGVDPQGPPEGQFRVLRGGSWNHLAGSCRASDRYWFPPYLRFYYFGFRVVLAGPPLLFAP